MRSRNLEPGENVLYVPIPLGWNRTSDFEQVSNPIHDLDATQSDAVKTRLRPRPPRCPMAFTDCGFSLLDIASITYISTSGTPHLWESLKL